MLSDVEFMTLRTKYLTYDLYKVLYLQCCGPQNFLIMIFDVAAYYRVVSKLLTL